MTKITDIPAIRFKGFSDTWEQRKFSDLVQIERGGSPRPIDDFITDSPDGLNWVKIGDAPAQGNYITKTAEKIKPEGLSKTREVHPGDLILSNSMSFGKPYIMGIDGCIHDGWLLIRNTYKVFDLTFLCHLLGTPQMIIQYKSLAAGSTVNNLNKELVGNTVVTIPTIKEQRVLGQYLETLDNLITLHQRKYDKLTNVKKSMLEKMFPQNGSNVPEIRFKGFTEAWEQRKLKDYLTVSAEKNTGNIYGRSDVLSVSGDYGIVNQIEFQGRSFAGASVSNYGVVQTGDVVYTKSPLNSNPYGIIKTNKGKPGIVSTLYAVYHPKENAFSDFIQVYFEQHARMNNYMHPLVNKGAKNDMKVSAENALKGPVCFPSRIEQESISAFFSVLDNLITLHQCKCQIDGCRFQSPLAITWEQRKVTEIGKIYIGLVTTMTKHYTDEGTLLIRNSDIKDGKFEFGDNPIYLEKTFAEKNETRMHQIGDVITVHTGDVGTSAVITENEAKSIGFATIVTRPNPKIIDSNYLCSFLNTDKHKKWAVSISTGDGRTNYNLGDYFELVVPVPSIAEQKKIASYIQKLNRLITLHQCE